jgi:putative ABC transport system permease protein
MTGDRNDWTGDLAELFAERRRARGFVYALRRLVVDALSLAVPSPRLGTVVQDMRHALRLFRAHAGIVSVTIAGLGLAIAMCTTVFSILNATILRPFEMDDPSTVVKVQRLYQNGMSTAWPYSAFVELQRGAAPLPVQASLADEVRFQTGPEESPAKPERILFVSGGYLPMLGGRTTLGRTLDASDDRADAAPVVVLSDEFWTRYFNRDPTVIGRTLKFGAGSATIAGVMRPKFSGPIERPPSFWAPFASFGAIYASATISPTSQIEVTVTARANSPAAQEQLSSVAAGLQPIGSGGPGSAPGKTTGVQFESAASRISGPDAASVYVVIVVIFVILSLVLALACANVANLLLAGASSRAREFGVRVAMGASRGRLLRQLLSESVVIGAGAGVIGFLLSLWMVPTLARVVGVPASYGISPDLAVMMFTMTIAVISGLGAGLAPARYGARTDVAGILKSQGLQSGASPKASRIRRAFIAFQAAASMLLLVTAALFLRAALHITHIDLGFDASRLLTVSVAFPNAPAFGASASAADQTRLTDYWRAALERVRALPSVEEVSLGMYPPFSGLSATSSNKRNGSDYVIFRNRTDAGYFRATGLRIVRGRAYTPEEVAGRAPVALVSEHLVRDFLPGAEPIGASLDGITGEKGVTIIGVVAEAVVSQLRDPVNGTEYRPIEPRTLADARLVVRSAEPDHVGREVEAALVSIDPRVRPSSSVMQDDVDKVMDEPKILAGLSGAVALLALVLSVLGIFGVTSFVVGQRTQEVSVRMAIGASAGDVVRLLIRQTVWPVVGGLTVGLAVALLGSRVLTGALSGISPYDPLAIVPATLLLAITALAAVAIPALRAARTDPAAVLRQ